MPFERMREALLLLVWGCSSRRGSFLKPVAMTVMRIWSSSESSMAVPKMMSASGSAASLMTREASSTSSSGRSEGPVME